MGRKGQMFSAERIGLILIAAALLAIAAVMIFRRPEPQQVAPDDVHQAIVDSVKDDTTSVTGEGTEIVKEKSRSKKSAKQKKKDSKPTPPQRDHLDEPINSYPL